MAKKKVIKIDNEVKKRGVKPGVKRGPYKKRAEIAETAKLIKNEFNETENKETIKPNEEQINGIDNKINSGLNDNSINPDHDTGIKNVSLPAINSVDDNDGESLLNDFIKQNGTSEEFKPNNETVSSSSAFSGHTEVKQTRPQSQQMIISGYMLLSLCDFIAPNLLLRIFKYLSPGSYEGIKASKLKLTSEQKEQLRESADEVAKMIFAEVSPLTVFFIGLAGFYYSNLQDAKAELDERKKQEIVELKEESKTNKTRKK